MKLEKIVSKYKNASSFIDWFEHTKGAYLTKYHYYWDVACLLSDIGNKNIINIVKGRGVGMTFMYAAYAAWMAQQGKKVLYVSHDNVRAREFIKTTDSISWYCSINRSENKLYFPFWDGKKEGCIQAVSYNNLSKGESADLIIVDEFAIFSNPGNALKALIPMAAYGKIIISSTPSSFDYSGSYIFEDLCNKHGYYHVPVFDESKANEMRKYYSGDLSAYNRECNALIDNGFMPDYIGVDDVN